MIALAAAAIALPDYVPEVVDRWANTVKVTVQARHCGFDNAWYTFKTRTVTLCDDLFDRPEVTRFVLNHELGHAFTHQHGVPFIDNEVAADELAFFMSTDDEVYAGAAWFLAMGGTTSDDDHPSNVDRAGSLLCLQSAQEGQGSRECRIYLRSALSHWLRWFDFVL
jgi:hypothetical protein